MTKRILLAGLLGGIAMYIWTAIAHMVLPLGEAGIKEIPNEATVLSAMRTSLGDTSGLYLFPGRGVGPGATSDQKKAAMQHYGQKLAASPSGILMYNPPGMQALAPRQFIAEFLKELIEALLAAVLLARARLATFGARFGFVVMVGVVASIGTNVSYWNWYGFPLGYTSAYITTQVLGFVWVGLIAAAIVKPSTASRPS